MNRGSQIEKGKEWGIMAKGRQVEIRTNWEKINDWKHAKGIWRLADDAAAEIIEKDMKRSEMVKFVNDVVEVVGFKDECSVIDFKERTYAKLATIE